MPEEMILLRAIAVNPYDDSIRGAYADWLDEHGRHEEASAVRVTFLRPTLRPANWMTNQELIGKLLGFPLDAGVIYDACSSFCTLAPDDVTLIKAEEKKVVFREQEGYREFDPNLYEDTCSDGMREHMERLRRMHPDRYPVVGEKPNFRTVVHFPGN